jgi:universal stress protein A
MQNIRHILVPTDFSAPAKEALDVGLFLAERFGATLTLLHVFQPPIFVYAADIYVPFDELERRAGDATRALAADARVRYPNVEPLVVEGTAWDRIVDIADRRGVDLIVLGTHGRRGISHLVLGSVAEKVVRMSPVPVLTTRGPAADVAA